ncbi:MAG TPA: HAD family phosphatase [Gemmataceae bacterium]|nr:HAD family phosphatase [Gemmataceae bacterium]
MSIRTLVFDLGNVIAFFDHRRASKRLAEHSGMTAEEVHAVLFDKRLEDDYESGRLATEELLRYARKRCGFTCPDEVLIEAYGDIFWPNPNVIDLLPRLKPNYRLLLLSNTCDLHARKFLPQFADALRHFDALVLSHQVGLRKPRPEMFAHALQLARCRAEECLLIDDLPANVAGAKACGWQGIVYRGAEELRRELAEHGVQWSAEER